MTEDDKLILMGVILSAHGIKGEIIVKSLTKPKPNICKLQLVDVSKNLFKIKLLRLNNNGNLICKVNDINNRNNAERLAGCKLFCFRSTLPNLDSDEFYIEDLKGLKVVDKDLHFIGEVNGIYNFGAGNLIEIVFAETKKMELFPFTKEFFPEISPTYIVLK